MESWAATREDANERQVLPSLFEKYVEATRTIVRKGFKEVTPLRVLNKVKFAGVVACLPNNRKNAQAIR